MKLAVDEDNVIIGYCDVGDIPNSVEYDGTIPDGFESNFKPSFYMLKNGAIIENPNYVEPADIPPDDGPSSIQEAINKLGETTAKMANDDTQIKTAINKLGLAVAELKTKEVK
ncbi:DUF2977 domain-containing protein [Pediococcus acidilactici]|uniref:DUF2977 domain-containing protein n=1 Tax=Pediococcus acidilactici TaxID=1254 RepID=UPI003B42F4E8